MSNIISRRSTVSDQFLHIHTDRQTDRHIDRQTHRQTDTQT